ncbi:MAG: hypothetical protein JST92_19205 [Deltaproteobacteria bacterium]|nr:hypothetical protein [Deltaproteobacteria bacterium]
MNLNRTQTLFAAAALLLAAACSTDPNKALCDNAGADEILTVTLGPTVVQNQASCPSLAGFTVAANGSAAACGEGCGCTIGQFKATQYIAHDLSDAPAWECNATLTRACSGDQPKLTCDSGFLVLDRSDGRGTMYFLCTLPDPAGGYACNYEFQTVLQ